MHSLFDFRKYNQHFISNSGHSPASLSGIKSSVVDGRLAPVGVTAKGYGFTVPVASNSTAEGRAQNRRTEVKILE
jgi:hypothetical protein